MSPDLRQPSQEPPLDQARKMELLRELAELKNQGILTEAEFAAEKQKILSR